MLSWTLARDFRVLRVNSVSKVYRVRKALRSIESLELCLAPTSKHRPNFGIRARRIGCIVKNPIGGQYLKEYGPLMGFEGCAVSGTLSR